MNLKSSERPELKLDSQTQQGFCSFVKNLPETDGKTIRLFERDNEGYYSVHGDDAFYVARKVYKTLTVIKYLGEEGTKGLPSCTLSKLNTEIFLKKALLEDQLRIEIWSNPEPRKVSLWRASPGNLQQIEDMIFANTDSSTTSVIMSAWLTNRGDQKVIGAAFVDTSLREFGVTEFIENDAYSNLESLLIQHQAKECLVLETENTKDQDIQAMINALERYDVMVTPCKKKMFETSSIEQDINRLIKGDVPISARPEYDLKNAITALSAIIKYLNLLGNDKNEGIFNLKQYNLNQYMRLDISAVRALNLTPSASDGANKTMSLQGLLDKCKTAQGSRLLSQWIKQPLLDADLIIERQKIVGLFFENVELTSNIQNTYLKTVPDLARLTRKLTKSSASLQDVVRIYQLVIKLPGLYDLLNSIEPEYKELFSKFYTVPLENHIQNTVQFQEMVEATIDLELVDSHQYVVKPDYDENLQSNEMDQAMKLMVREQSRVADALNMEAEKKLKLEKSSLYGYCFRLSRNDASCIRNKQSLYPELTTQKNGVYFTTKALREQSLKFQDSSEQYSKSQSSLVNEILKVSATYCPVLLELGNTLAHLDVLISFAVVSMSAPTPYTCPEISTSKRSLILKGSRHPCLEAQEDVHFISNDVELVRGESEFLIITGPNMGGKSTYIRQIGMIALMAQIGCFVPCDEATVCLFDSILARVGAGDALIKGISTFMAEMLETASIIKSATSNSLIIIDELGRGTSTYDGFGLAWAISEHIINEIGSFCLFATHFHELTNLAKDFEIVQNLQVLASTDSAGDNNYDITLLYKIEKGVCDQSFGIHVAQLAKFPQSVLNLAKRRVEELENYNSNTGSKESQNGVSYQENLDSLSQFSKLEIEEGSKIIEEFLVDFAQIKDLSGLDGIGVAYQVDTTPRVGGFLIQELITTFYENGL
ncbi:hypothetical protein BB560_005685 [Smittium megazygosporum]|uniref:DNA mismatch repair protein MSH2 n=1 Tax=Smittium megazygosporum TaxID=133381 RepID=A0A2T9Z1E3_9FUNG|nr:hypothetical protein BB560_005685 [Smittium megazygosporum]